MRLHILFYQRQLRTLLSALILLASIGPMSAAAPAAVSDAPTVAATPWVRPRRIGSGTTPPTDAQCRSSVGVPCYSPAELQRAYGLSPVLSAGFNGTGQTIIVVDSFGSPTIQQDLRTFDAAYGLTDPPSFQVLAPLGTVAFNSKNPLQVGWAEETTLDVEWSHAMAPGANIVLLTSPVAETEGVQGMPQFLQLEQYALAHKLGEIISQSWGATENTFETTDGRQVLASFETLYQQAASQNVTVLASSGDGGVSNEDLNNNPYPFQTVNYPASSPWVTAVGGTSLNLSTQGAYQSEVVWNGGQPNSGASGGGVSQLYAEPTYQKSALPATDQTILKGFRGVPDVAYDADLNTGILVYSSFIGIPVGWSIIGGTSAASPQWAGIIADGNQQAGHPLGFLNPMLYSVGAGASSSTTFHDITQGNNAQGNLTGYHATTGWDPATGWGSPYAATLLTALAKAKAARLARSSSAKCFRYGAVQN